MDKKKVLLVDDSMAIANQLQKILDNSGVFEVVGHAKNGAEGIQLYASMRPDIVCMDIVMPVMDGLQAIRAIMNMDKNAKIVVISSAAGVGDTTTEAVRFGAKNVIAKPFEQDTIIKVLKTL
jgi:two-component system chemotaxis response regulator CheY